MVGGKEGEGDWGRAWGWWSSELTRGGPALDKLLVVGGELHTGGRPRPGRKWPLLLRSIMNLITPPKPWGLLIMHFGSGGTK